MKKRTKEKSKCWACRKPTKGGAIFCKKCEKDEKARKPTASTYVIYTSV